MNKKIEDFSGGLWRLKATLIPYDGDRATMSIEDIKPFLIESETDEPLLIRVRGVYVSVWQSSGIPYKSIAIPRKYEEHISMDLPEDIYILIPKRQNQMKSILNAEDNDFSWQIPEGDFEDLTDEGGKIP